MIYFCFDPKLHFLLAAKREEIEEPIFEDDDEDDSDEYDDSEFKSTTCDVVD